MCYIVSFLLVYYHTHTHTQFDENPCDAVANAPDVPNCDIAVSDHFDRLK